MSETGPAERDDQPFLYPKRQSFQTHLQIFLPHYNMTSPTVQIDLRICSTGFQLFSFTRLILKNIYLLFLA